MGVLAVKTIFAACCFYPVRLATPQARELKVAARGENGEEETKALLQVPDTPVSTDVTRVWSTRACIGYFCTLGFASGMSVGLFLVLLHPLLVHRFHLGQGTVRRVDYSEGDEEDEGKERERERVE